MTEESFNKVPVFKREKEVLRKVYFQNTSYSSREIAEQLCVCERTIEDHKYHIQKKIKAKNMIGIALYAARTGLVSMEDLMKTRTD